MLKGIEGKKIIVVGDMVLDHYRTMVPERVSPEAPVIIYRPSEEEWRAGGAANVANNLLALRADVKFCTVMSHEAKAQLKKCGPINEHVVAHFDNYRKPTVKERIVTKRQQILRIDKQPDEPISSDSVDGCFNLFKKLASRGCDLIVMSDYNHGVMTMGLATRIMKFASLKKIKVVVDSKAKDTVRKYYGATIALPNHIEARSVTGMGSEFSDEAVAATLMHDMNLEAIGLKCGPKGIMLIQTGSGSKMFPPLEHDVKTEVADVTGAGDTVTAMVAAALACNHSNEEAIELANIAAGIVVQKMGTSVASYEEVKSIWGKRS